MRKLMWSLCALLGFAASSQAAVIAYSNQATFLSQGTIVHNTNFDTYPTTGPFTFPGDPFTIGGVTYTTGNNLIVAPGSGYGNSRNVFVNNFWSPLPGSISTAPQQFDMFSFSIGLLGSNSLVNITLTTNLGVYNFNGLSFPNVNTNPGLAFQGFIASPGEYFTGFSIASQSGSGFAPAITDVRLGQAAAIPEPISLVVFGGLIVGGGLVARKRLMKKLVA